METEVRGERYNIVGVLGEGGMGTVYLAEDRRLPGKTWAIKEIRRGKFGRGGMGEAAALVRLSHPGLPQIADYFETDDGECGYLVMEYIEGETMEQRFVRCGRKPEPETVIRWAVQLCDVLAYLHGIRPHPVVHRDLKPSNVLITAQERVVLIDFGISRLDRGRGPDTVQLGTFGFAAPELLQSGRTDPRSDLYALGAMLFYLLSGGRHPQGVHAVSDQLARVPFSLRQIVEKLLEPDPEHRFPDAESVKAALVPFLAESLQTDGDRGAPWNPPRSSPGRGGRKRILALLSLHPGAGSTVAGLASGALLRRLGVAHAYLEHPAAEPVLDGWLDPDLPDVQDGGGVWLTGARLRERYGTWNEAAQWQTLLEAEAQVVVADLSHAWEAETVEPLLALADETVVVAGPRPMALGSRPVRDRLRQVAHWLESGRSVSLFWNGSIRRPDPPLDDLPFRTVLRLPHCPAFPDWERSGNPWRLTDDSLWNWSGKIEDWLQDLCNRWKIPVTPAKKRNRPGNRKKALTRLGLKV